MADVERDGFEVVGEHAWKYFELHAQQRMAIFNFFLVLSGVILAGIAGCIEHEPKFKPFEGLLGGALFVVSIVFWKLDQRTSFLIKRAEVVLSQCESKFPDYAQLFSSEPLASEKASREEAIWTYSRSFRVVHFLTGCAGVTTIMISLYR